MDKNRPVNLSIASMRFPITAIASILHRISGLLLFLLIPVLLWWLEQSLKSQQSFSHLVGYFLGPYMRFIAWVVISATVYHLTAGIKHLLMDVGLFEEKESGRFFSWLVIIFVAIVVVLLGVWLWG